LKNCQKAYLGFEKIYIHLKEAEKTKVQVFENKSKERVSEGR
jgi:hypothetical protein